ncbi:MAG: DUF1638 domain-containing protein [Eubacteriales bacterium]|nr:DUF1638 domain-containing protein [Eubacteriales bacterium]
MSEICIIGCRALEKELRSAMEACGCKNEIIWTDPGLHNVKSKYKDVLQNILDDLPSDCRTALLVNGFCGNSIQGIVNSHATLIIPRVDDCISLLFGGYRNKKPYMDSYFLTESWMNGKQTIFQEYKWACEKYGTARARRIFEKMFRNYRRIAILDTGCYDTASAAEYARDFSEMFSLKQEIVPAGIRYLKDILTGPWDDLKFLIVQPHHMITEADLMDLY